MAIIMKTLVLFALLAVVPVSLGAALPSNIPTTVGVAEPGDHEFFRTLARAGPRPGHATTVTITPIMSSKYIANAVSFKEQGTPQGAYVSSVTGLGTNFIRYSVTSQSGKGLHVIADIWGRDVTADRSSAPEMVEQHFKCTMTVSDGVTEETRDC
ncbi:uncharacterized protein LOC124637645 [Helicoverpa zea]|uniref:uncharacterized protein LOC124637645 n=1 Tax=Helicoverpa zea TaxID=7113 RepID=UPI001F58903E|nr:uncharacterized protein LOC124637645 [Helicoverpa zea]